MSSQPDPPPNPVLSRSFGSAEYAAQLAGSKRRASSTVTKPLAKRIHSSTEADELVAERTSSEVAEVGDEMEDLQPSRSQSTVDQTPGGYATPEAPSEQHEQLSQWDFGKEYFPPDMSQLSQTPSPRSGSTGQSPLTGATETNIWRMQYMGLQEPRSLSETLNAATEEELLQLERHRRNAISGTEPELRPFRRDSRMEEEDDNGQEN